MYWFRSSKSYFTQRRKETQSRNDQKVFVKLGVLMPWWLQKILRIVISVQREDTKAQKGHKARREFRKRATKFYTH